MSTQSTPQPSSAHVERRMQNQRQRDTRPEKELRSELWRRGLRYRVDFKAVGRRRRVDIAFTRVKVAVMVDGCFWHQCPEHGSLPKANGAWWAEKLSKNVERDRATDLELAEAGWLVIRVWEHESMSEAADRIEESLRERRAAGPAHPDP